MAQYVTDKIKARFIDCPADSEIAHYVGCSGDLMLAVSEHKFPGKFFAVLKYSDEEKEKWKGWALPSYKLKTSPCDICLNGNVLTMERIKGGNFVFELLDSNSRIPQQPKFSPGDKVLLETKKQISEGVVAVVDWRGDEADAFKGSNWSYDIDVQNDPSFDNQPILHKHVPECDLARVFQEQKRIKNE